MSGHPEDTPEPDDLPEDEVPDVEVRVDRPDPTRPLIGSEEPDETDSSDP